MAERKKTKKLINRPDDVISELIDGMVGAHPDLLRVEGPTGRAIVAVDGPRDGKVGIVVGGGSGHEPLFSGYVGRGLADASAVGNIFASPSPDQIADAARAADGGAGVVFVYGNYTGDVMNFDMAGEIVASEGIRATSVQVTDDVVSAPPERKSERRGIAGDIFVLKVAGASADRGEDFDSVIARIRHANASTASMGVALGPCSLPQTATPNFEIGDDEMEIGMGIHGEPGIARITLETADRVADRLLLPILGDLSLVAGDEVAVMINGLGSTTMLELYLLHRRVRQVLGEQEIQIHRSLVGEFATSLEMAGASVTLMKLDPDLKILLDHPCHSVALKIGEMTKAPAAVRSQATRAKAISSATETGRKDLKTDGDVTPAMFRDMMAAIASRIAQEKDHLCELDGAIGDGDHGVTMDVGWRAVMTDLAKLQPDASVTQVCRVISKAFLEAVGASAGPLYATGFLRAGEAVNDRLNLDAEAIAAWLLAMATGISERGKARPGDKTMMDAWAPAAEAAVRAAASGQSSAQCLTAAGQAARAGMTSTATMQARLGRAAKLGDRSIGSIDAGAASAVMLIEAMAEVANAKN